MLLHSARVSKFFYQQMLAARISCNGVSRGKCTIVPRKPRSCASFSPNELAPTKWVVVPRFTIFFSPISTSAPKKCRNSEAKCSSSLRAYATCGKKNPPSLFPFFGFRRIICLGSHKPIPLSILSIQHLLISFKLQINHAFPTSICSHHHSRGLDSACCPCHPTQEVQTQAPYGCYVLQSCSEGHQ